MSAQILIIIGKLEFCIYHFSIFIGLNVRETREEQMIRIYIILLAFLTFYYLLPSFIANYSFISQLPFVTTVIHMNNIIKKEEEILETLLEEKEKIRKG